MIHIHTLSSMQCVVLLLIICQVVLSRSYTQTLTYTHAHTPLVPSDNRSNIAAIAGGVIGGLVVLGVIISVSLLVGITVAWKRGKYNN